MSLTGIFLLLFLTVHLLGNLQLFHDDGGKAFNQYTHFMGHNLFIQTVAKGLYFFILLHSVQGIILAIKNRKAKGLKYAVSSTQQGSWASRHMALLGILIFAFLMIHMGDFWWKLKFHSEYPTVIYDGVIIKDAFLKVGESFQNPIIVIAYLIGLIALAIHLYHGFESAFQTLGWQHKKYTPFIRILGIIYSIVVPAGFAALPIYMYFI